MADTRDGEPSSADLSLERDRDDSRARIIPLTPRGRRLHQIGVGIHAQIEAGWSQAIGPKRYYQLRRALDDLIAPADRRRPRRQL
jgi:DNA-binding MarR family transcriptional regulator